MITKEHIEILKNNGNNSIKELFNKQKDTKTLVFILENLGHLPKEYNGK
ncbi:MAG: hypothetical protein U9Q98_12770 [Bacteroidota bacterium]|nr:hypothetical protein [Bacteroidota bacterium]